MTLLVIIGLVACDEGTSETKEVDSAQADSKEKTETENIETEDVDEVGEEEAQTEEEDATEEETNYDEVLIDEDSIKVTLIDIEKVTGDDWDQDHYLVNLDIENKTDNTVEVQTREFSADGKMIDDMIMFSETVSGGKSADGSIEIMDWENDNLPEIEEEMEFILNVSDSETWETTGEYNVKINLK